MRCLLASAEISLNACMSFRVFFRFAVLGGQILRANGASGETVAAEVAVRVVTAGIEVGAPRVVRDV